MRKKWNILEFSFNRVKRYDSEYVLSAVVRSVLPPSGRGLVGPRVGGFVQGGGGCGGLVGDRDGLSGWWDVCTCSGLLAPLHHTQLSLDGPDFGLCPVIIKWKVVLNL